LKSRGDFDLYPDERSQVYGGVRAEDPRTTAAVRATAGQVLTYAGKIITAFFFSSSGGRTEDVRNVFTGYGPAPYLVSVPDPFDFLSPNHRWSDPPSFSGAQLGRLLGMGGSVRTLTVERRGSSPRVLRILAVTTSGRRVEMTGTQVRRALKLRDTWFTVVRRPLTPATAGLLRPTPPVVPPAPPPTVTAPATTTTPTPPTTTTTTTPAQPPAP
jgi:stage II sporulation protein D